MAILISFDAALGLEVRLGYFKPGCDFVSYSHLDGDSGPAAVLSIEGLISSEMENQWYAVYTRSRHEKKVASSLSERNIEVFLPLRRVIHRWKDREKEVDLPLFSSYVFVRIPLTEKLHVLRTPGVVHILSEARTPVPVPEEQIQAIQQVIESGLKFDPYPYLKKGMTVTIVRGPLRGLEGILVEKRKRHLLVLSVDLIQQSAALEVNISDTDVK